MKTLFLLLLTFTATANATNWQLVTDSDRNDIRLLVDVDTVVIDKYDRNGSGKKLDYRISSTMSYLTDSDESHFLVIIDADDCLRKGAGTLVSLDDSASKPRATFWSMQGHTMKDAQGQWMCGYLKGSLEASKLKQRNSNYM